MPNYRIRVSPDDGSGLDAPWEGHEGDDFILVTQHSRYTIGEQPRDMERWYEDKADKADKAKAQSLCDAYNDWHSDDILPEGVSGGDPDEWYNEQIKKLVEDHWFVFPVYMYEHSGIALSLEPFSCPWDSGQLGELLLKQDGCTYEQALDSAQQYIKCCHDYLSGNCWHFEVERQEGEYGEWSAEDSCGGFYGDPEDLIDDFCDHSFGGLNMAAKSAFNEAAQCPEDWVEVFMSDALLFVCEIASTPEVRATMEQLFNHGLTLEKNTHDDKVIVNSEGKLTALGLLNTVLHGIGQSRIVVHTDDSTGEITGFSEK
jgi:hypothetical protein